MPALRAASAGCRRRRSRRGRAEPLDDVLDRAELVRDVEDGDAELAVELARAARRALLGVGVDAGRGLVEDQQPRLGGERLGDEGALLLAARERRDRLVRLLRRARRASIACVDGVAVVGGRAARAAPPARRGRPRRPRGRSRAPRSRAAPAAGGSRSEPARARGADRLAEEQHRRRAAAARARRSAGASVVLPPPFGPAIATNSPCRDRQVDVARAPAGRGRSRRRRPSSSTASGIRAPFRARRGSRA